MLFSIRKVGGSHEEVCNKPYEATEMIIHMKHFYLSLYKVLQDIDVK